jgi:hypothetical protein
MNVTFGKGILSGAAGTAVLLAIIAAAGGNGLGAVFNLGRINRVNNTSTLTGANRGPMLTVANAGRGTALNLKVGKGRAPFTVNSGAQVSKLNASMLGGLGASAFVHGAGQMNSRQVTVPAGQMMPVLALSPYGRFQGICDAGPIPSLQFINGPHPDHLWINISHGASSNLAEDDLAPAAGDIETVGAPTMLQYIIQDARSTGPNARVASVVAVMMASGSSCDFALVVHSGA